MEHIREIIGENLAELRKKKGLTQYELAEKFSYSDKAISKWENGTTLPDIEVLYQLCEFYDVTLDYLTHKENKEVYVKDSTNAIKRNRIAIACLLVSIVWMIATIFFVYQMLNGDAKSTWTIFIWAIPISCLILAYLDKLYFKSKKFLFWVASILVWSTIVGIFFEFIHVVPWPLFLVGIPTQITLIIWSNILPKKKQ